MTLAMKLAMHAAGIARSKPGAVPAALTRAALALVGLALAAGVAFAQAPSGDPCQVGDGVLQAGFPMPHVAAAIAAKKLDVAVLGTTSSALASAGGPAKAYPARFEAALKEKLPDVAVRVASYARPRQTAPDLEKELARIVARDKPALVLWQTGTADAIRGVDSEAFRTALDEGVAAARAAGSDLILINMQYSPRTETMIALSAYLDEMRFVALQHEINLFDRFAVMKYWSESGAFDLSAVTKKTDLAEKVHACIGQLLADFVMETAKLTKPGDKDSH
jgi:lysophospholipase L1-like esterase